MVSKPKTRNNSVVFFTHLTMNGKGACGSRDGHLGEVGFKKLWGGVQTGNPIASSWGTNQNNQSSNKHFLVASQDENK